MKFLRFINDIFRKYPRLMVVNVLLMVLGGLIEAGSVVTLAPIIDILTNQDLKGISPLSKRIAGVIGTIGIPVGLVSLMTVFFSMNVFRTVFYIWIRRHILKVKYVLTKNILFETYDTFFNARWHFFTSNKQGTLLNTFLREMGVVSNTFGYMGRFFAMLVQVLAYFAIPMIISWQITCISVVLAILLSLPFFMFRKISVRLGKENTCTANKIAGVIQESLGSAKIILGFGNKYIAKKKLVSAFNDNVNVTIKSQVLNVAIEQMFIPLGILVMLITLFMARSRGIPLSEMAVMLYSFFRAIPLFGRIASLKHSIDNFYPSYEQISKLSREAMEMEQPSGTKVFGGFNKEIVLEDVSFSYPGQEQILHDINIRIPKGNMIAIVGESGAGKSTLIDMLMGFIEPSSGKIRVDGVDIQDFKINSYRGRIGYVPQESTLFNMTIADNIRWANNEASDTDIQKACQLANADKFIEGFPDGYDVVVGDRGVRLSGGQAQRIALARAIVRNPELLILDEATSALDTQSERLIQQAIERITGKTTVIVIAHRLSTIIKSDCIYVLENARIVEEGTYSELVKANGFFNTMVAVQELGEEKLNTESKNVAI